MGISRASVLSASVHSRHAPVLHLLGGPYVTIGEQRMEVPEGCNWLLAFVALNRRCVERRYVAGALWPEGNDGRAAGNLRSAIWRLRCSGTDILVVGKWSLALRDEVVVDVQLVNDWAARIIDGTASAADLTAMPWQADGLELLPGWRDDWTMIERELTRQRMLHALEALSRLLVGVGRCAEAIEASLIAVSAEPLRESAQRVLIEAHLAEGNWVEGRRHYLAYRDLLHRELGLEPSPDLRNLLHPG